MFAPVRSATTYDLQRELEGREGIASYYADLTETYEVRVAGHLVRSGTGPCTITVNID